MGGVAIVVLFLALAGALASWIIGAVYSARVLAAIDGSDGTPSRRWLRSAAWPLALGQVRGANVPEAAIVNKAIVAFLICVTLAATTVSLSTNLNRVSR